MVQSPIGAPPVSHPKSDVDIYNANIKRLYKLTIDLCGPYSPSGCKSIKYHWPLHWASTRIQIGFAAMEKSLERKLGETHGKANFRFTNYKGNKEVHHLHCTNSIEIPLNCTLM